MYCTATQPLVAILLAILGRLFSLGGNQDEASSSSPPGYRKDAERLSISMGMDLNRLSPGFRYYGSTELRIGLNQEEHYSSIGL